MHTNRLWLLFAIVTTLAWGLWGALLNLPAASGFPETLAYVVWSLTMIPPAIVALSFVGWKLDFNLKSIVLGMAAGLLGAGGQLVLFQTVPKMAPGYLVFPLIAICPIITILLAAVISRERVKTLGWIGVGLAIVAGVLLNWQSADDVVAKEPLWILYALIVLMAWGIQGYVISFANNSMKAESIFFYMALSGVALAPIAWSMTDHTQEINWGWQGPGLSAAIQLLNSIGALLLVYAYRYGKAIIVSPLTNAGAPVITAVLSLILLRTVPTPVASVGIVLAIAAAVMMAIEEEESPPEPAVD